MQPTTPDAWPIGAPLLVSMGDVNDPLGRSGFKDDLTGSYISNATGAIDVVRDQETQTAITGVTLPIAMTYLSGSNGVYYGEIPSGAQIAEGQKVEVRYTLSIAGKTVARWLRFYGEKP